MMPVSPTGDICCSKQRQCEIRFSTMTKMQKLMAENQDAIEEVGIDQSSIQIITLEG